MNSELKSGILSIDCSVQFGVARSLSLEITSSSSPIDIHSCSCDIWRLTRSLSLEIAESLSLEIAGCCAATSYLDCNERRRRESESWSGSVLAGPVLAGSSNDLRFCSSTLPRLGFGFALRLVQQYQTRHV